VDSMMNGDQLSFVRGLINKQRIKKNGIQVVAK